MLPSLQAASVIQGWSTQETTFYCLPAFSHNFSTIRNQQMTDTKTLWNWACSSCGFQCPQQGLSWLACSAQAFRGHTCVCKPRLQTRNMRFLIQTGQVAVFKLSQIFLQSRAHFSKTFFWRTQIMLGCIIHILTYFLPGVRVGGPGDVGDTLPQLKKGWCISLSLSPIEILAR